MKNNNLPRIDPFGFREYDARWLYPQNINLPGIENLGIGLGTQISDKTKRNLINVFVPTTPNPTSGFLLMFPKEDVIYLDLTFEEASKFIVSAGTSNPD